VTDHAYAAQQPPNLKQTMSLVWIASVKLSFGHRKMCPLTNKRNKQRVREIMQTCKDLCSITQALPAAVSFKNRVAASHAEELITIQILAKGLG
jgi:hypothetical protein